MFTSFARKGIKRHQKGIHLFGNFFSKFLGRLNQKFEAQTSWPQLSFIGPPSPPQAVPSGVRCLQGGHRDPSGPQHNGGGGGSGGRGRGRAVNSRRWGAVRECPVGRQECRGGRERERRDRAGQRYVGGGEGPSPGHHHGNPAATRWAPGGGRCLLSGPGVVVHPGPFHGNPHWSPPHPSAPLSPPALTLGQR